MNILLYYSLSNGALRRVTKPDNEAESDVLLKTAKSSPDQGLIVIDEKEYGDFDALQAIVSKQTGLTPEIKRYALVEPNGDVAGAILTDSAARIEGVQLIEHDKAAEGWKLQAGTFIDLNPPFIVKNPPPGVILGG